MRTRGAELLPGWAGLWAAEGFTWSSSGRFKGHATRTPSSPPRHVASPLESSSGVAACPAVLPSCLCCWA